MLLYLAGPMRGYPSYNFPAFDAAAKRLRSLGHDVISPAEMDRELGFDPDDDAPLPDGFVEDAMRRDLGAIVQCDGIALLPGWEKSKGTANELSAARACGLSVYDVDDDATVLNPWQMHDFERVDAPWPIAEPQIGGEVQTIDPSTGGRKGTKPQRFDLIPWDVLWELSEHYASGAAKYGDDNWRRGYRWSLNFAALMRHLTAWWEGEDFDEELGNSHLVAVIWHAITLRFFQKHGRGTDDRPLSRAA